jgi:magnesium transporter
MAQTGRLVIQRSGPAPSAIDHDDRIRIWILWLFSLKRFLEWLLYAGLADCGDNLQEARTATAIQPRSRPEPGVIASGVYADGRLVAEVPVDQAGAWSRRPGHVVWIGLLEPDDGMLARLQAQFDLHPLALKDASRLHRRPKLEQYGDALFIVVRTAQLAAGGIVFGATRIFIGPGYVVTLRDGASASYAAVRQRCDAGATMAARGEDRILAAILDFIVGNYGPVLDTIHAEVEAMERSVFVGGQGQFDVQRLYRLRRDLFRLRNAGLPLIEVCRRLDHADAKPVDPATRPLFRDISDRLLRLQEEIDGLREMLAFAFEASLMIAHSQQTVITRQLAAWAAILAVPTAIAGIYGMNFVNMPELKWRYGYFLVVGGIAAICATLYLRFRRSGWL